MLFIQKCRRSREIENLNGHLISLQGKVVHTMYNELIDTIKVALVINLNCPPKRNVLN